MSNQEVSRPEASGSVLAVVVRLSWLIVGNVALVFLALAIAQRPTASALDIVYGAIVMTLVGIRYLDITRMNGLTKDGEPATLRDWRRYVVALVLLSGALWGLAHTALRPVLGS